MDSLKEKVLGMLPESPFIRYLGIEIIELDEEHARGRMPFTDRYKNPYGTMHGGCLYALADTVAGTLANMSGEAVTTVEGGIHFLEPAADTDYVYCDAKMKRSGKHLITVEVELKDDAGKLLDCGCLSFFRTGYKLDKD